MAHEFIHNLGPGTEEDGVLRGWGLHSSSDADWPYPTLSIKTFGMSAAWGWPPLVISRLTPDIMSQVNPTNFSPTKWISPYRWENLMSYLDPPAAASTASIQQAGESLVISGWISENGTGSLRSIFRLPEAQESPSSPSNYSLVLKDSSGSTLLTHSFGVRFVDLDGEKHDPDYFTVLLPHLTGTQSVSLWNGTILLDQITASAYAPQVQVISPNGGETAENLFTVAWAASDLDGDPLTFKVFYSGDNGLSWTPVSPRIVGTAYLVNASRLPGGSQSLIRVVASDGFHTSEDQSDAVFTVPRKAPLDVVSFGMNPCIHNFGEPVVLKGSAFDPEDGVLNGTALTWFSDLNGTLGTGRVLTTTDLIPGTHNITLTATDSDGNNATYSFTVTVELRNVRIVEASSDRERAFRAQIVDVRATVSNPSDVYIVEPFNVSAYAHSEDPNKPPLLIGTQFVPDLQPKANLTIQFLWNTTGAPTGYYTISAIATPVIGEIDTSDNMFIDGLILITKAGDLGGGIPPKFFNFDDKVDGKDLALFIQCYRGLAPPEAMYLGDLGGGLPPQFFNFDSKVDGKDLALFIECYRGQGPDP